jgi:phosphatidylglycerophosphatase A
MPPAGRVYDSLDEDASFYRRTALMSIRPAREAFRRRPVAWLAATGLGVGAIPFAPGTFGSLEGLALAWGIDAALRPRGAAPVPLALAVAGAGLLVAAVGIFAAGLAETAFGAKDPPAIVVDEIAGQLLACAPVAAFPLHGNRWGLWIFSLACFRILDVWKPGPIRRLQDLPGGLGVVLDDVAAGLVAGALTWALARAL